MLENNGWNWDLIDELVPISSDSENEHNIEEISLYQQLVSWVNRLSVKHNAVDELLKILRKHGHAELPGTAQTLLQTTRNVSTQTRPGMQCSYLGLEEGLLECVKVYKTEITESVRKLELSINIDGISIFKSTSNSLWPILCALMNVKPFKVFLVALCYGKSKPDNLDFLSETVTDLNHLMQLGLHENMGCMTTWVA